LLLKKYIYIDDPVLQQVATNDVAGVSVIKEDLGQEKEEINDNSSSVQIHS
jgi:hypothetical protein